MTMTNCAEVQKIEEKTGEPDINLINLNNNKNYFIYLFFFSILSREYFLNFPDENEYFGLISG